MIDKSQPTNDSDDQKNMLMLAVGCFAEKINDRNVSHIAREHYQKSFDFASKMLDIYWRTS